LTETKSSPPLHSQAVTDLLGRLDRGASCGCDLRVWQEAITRACASLSSVTFATVLVDAVAHTVFSGGDDRADDHCCLWRTGAADPVWQGMLAEAASLFAATEQLGDPILAGAGDLPVGLAWPADWPRECASWQLVRIDAREHPALLVVVGSQRSPSREAAAEISDLLSLLRERLATQLTTQWELMVLRSELQAARSENEAMSRLNRMQARFVAMASHELKTPLTSITAYTEALQQHLDDSQFPHTREFLDVIRGEAGRLLRLTNRILDFSRLGFGRRVMDWQVVDLRPLIETAARSMTARITHKNQTLASELPMALPRIEGDPDLIGQVVINLLTNALKYTPAGGRISITASEDAATVKISVTDTGPGIAPEELRRIFQQFYRVGGTAAKEGAGLGLTIVKYIVNLHGGHIDAQSRLGEGATFSVLLPKEQYRRSAEHLLGSGEGSEHWPRTARLCLRMIAEMLRVRSVLILGSEQAEPRLALQAAVGLPRVPTADLRFPATSPFWTHVLGGGEPLGEDSAALLPAELAAELPAGPWLAAPLRVDGQIAGAVVVARKLETADFDADDRTLLAILSETVGAALTALNRPAVDSGEAHRIADALQALMLLKHSGVPSATPVALRLIGSTAAKLGLSPVEVGQLQYIAALHDAGMVRVDDAILHKVDGLSLDERDEVDRHPEEGADLVAPLVPTPELLEIIRHHHERVDGQGYPEGRRQQEIPLGARILLVVDAFFAMIKQRPYRDAIPALEVAREIERHAGTQFDPRVVEVFVAVLREEGFLDPASDGNDAGPRRPDTVSGATGAKS